MLFNDKNRTTDKGEGGDREGGSEGCSKKKGQGGRN